MYRTCAFEGCEVPFHRCEIHHIVPWERGGPTDLDNLIPLCSRHHHVVHELGWKLRLEADRTLVIVQPDGTEYARTRPHLTQHHTQPGTDPPGADPRPAPPGADPPDPAKLPRPAASKTGPPGSGKPPGKATSNTGSPDTGPPEPGEPPDSEERTPAA